MCTSGALRSESQVSASERSSTTRKLRAVGDEAGQRGERRLGRRGVAGDERRRRRGCGRRGPGRRGHRAGRRPSSSWGCAGRSCAAAGRGRRHRRRTAGRGSSPGGRGRCPSACRACGHRRGPRRGVLVEWVPWRAAACWATTTWWISGMLTSTSKISAGRSTLTALAVGAAVLGGRHAQASFCALLGGRAEDHETALGAGDGALEQDQALLGVDGVDGDVLGGDGVATHPAGHPDALEHATGGGAGADRARLAVVAVGTVGGADAVEAVTLHHTGEALALAWCRSRRSRRRRRRCRRPAPGRRCTTRRRRCGSRPGGGAG